MVRLQKAFGETAAYLNARAAGESAPKLAADAAAEAVAAILDATLPASLAPELIDAIRAASAADAVTTALAGEPRSVLHAEDILRDARLRGEAQGRILQARMLDAEAVGALLGSQSESNRRQYANMQRQRGDLLGVPRLNAYLYPAFQFDLERGCIRDIVSSINRRLGADVDPWGVASWWTTPMQRLQNRAPEQLLGTDEESVLVELAEAELAPLG
jgi:hypothetical protein